MESLGWGSWVAGCVPSREGQTMRQEGHRQERAGPDRWLCSFQNNSRKGGGGEAHRNWAGDPGGRAEGPGSLWRLQSLPPPPWHNLLPQPGSGAGRVTPVSGPSKGCEFSQSPQPIHFLQPRKETSEKEDGEGQREGGKAGEWRGSGTGSALRTGSILGTARGKGEP